MAPGSLSRYLTAVYALRTNRPREAVTLLREEPQSSSHQTSWTKAERIAAELAARDDPYDFGGNTYNRACIRARLGDLDRAVELLGQAHTEGSALGIWLRVDPDLRPLDGYPPFEQLIQLKG